jgi:hypothetical protein
MPKTPKDQQEEAKSLLRIAVVRQTLSAKDLQRKARTHRPCKYWPCPLGIHSPNQEHETAKRKA